MKSLRLAEVLGCLSLAIDLGVGQPMEWVMRSCLIGVQLSRLLGLPESDQRAVYYLSLLRHIGCTSTSANDAYVFGDELSIAEGMTADTTDGGEMLDFLLRVVGKGRPPLERLKTIARLFSTPTLGTENHNAHCDVAVRFATTLGFEAPLRDCLWQLYERWDGKGTPAGLKGEAIALPVRILHLAQDVATFYTTIGLEQTTAIVRKRAGKLYDPTLVAAWEHYATDMVQALETPSIWEALLAAEPGTPISLNDDQTDIATQAIGDFTDLKTLHTRGHSRSVAELAWAAGRFCNLPAPDLTLLRRAALVHDVGRVGVSSSLWMKAGVLTVAEQERVRMHPYLTERILSPSPTFATIGAVAAQHHERVDGSGYHRGLKGTTLSHPARLLAVANAYCALTEERPHRSRCSADECATYLYREVKAGRFDRNTVDGVLSAAGHAVKASKRLPATGLSERELQVLRLVVRGYSNREMAKALIISEKTVDHHIQHIYNKLGVSTRAGATLYAMQNDLVGFRAE